VPWQRVVSSSGALTAPCPSQRLVLINEGVGFSGELGQGARVRTSSFWQPSAEEVARLGQGLGRF
jgi:alkylated DNA nucleotide flippase Atl1